MATEKKFLGVDIEGGVNSIKDTSTNNFDIGKWVVDIENRVDEASEERSWRLGAIYKVPAFIRDHNPKAFTPQLVSFGPYHHGDCKLRSMEVHKKRALVQFIRRADRPLDELVCAVDGLIGELQDSYYDLDERWRRNKDEFLTLMITDGCFMYEVLRIYHGYYPNNNNESGYSHDDPLFSQHGISHMIPYIRVDMLLIENQMPLLLLEILVRFQSPQLVEEDLAMYISLLVIKFFNPHRPDARIHNIRRGLGGHPLSLFRQSLLITRRSRGTTYPDIVPPGAVGLNEAGVKFQSYSIADGLTSIRFDPGTGILYLPVLMVDDATGPIFLNIMAYEHLHVHVEKDVTSYVFFMGKIMVSGDDVRLLSGKGIICNLFGSSKEVVDLFKGISTGFTFVQESWLSEVQLGLHYYCQKRLTRCRAKLRGWWVNLVQTHFRSPWTALSLAGALILLGLTTIQAVFAILQYRQGN